MLDLKIDSKMGFYLDCRLYLRLDLKMISRMDFYLDYFSDMLLVEKWCHVWLDT